MGKRTGGPARMLAVISLAMGLGTTPGLAVAHDALAATTTPKLDEAPVIEWSELDDAPWVGKMDVVLSGAAVAPDGSVVVSGGSLFGPATVWRSVDLTDWFEVQLPDGERTLGTVTEMRDGLAVTATELSTGAGLLWTSKNGARWRKPTRTRKAEYAASDIVKGKLVIVGNAGTPRAPAPAIWSTRKGRKPGKTGLSKLRESGRVNDIASTPSGDLLLETTTYLRDEPRLHLRRADGGWRGVEVPALSDEAPAPIVGGIASSPTGIVLATNDGETSIIWHSPNASEWTPVAKTEEVRDLVRAGGHVFALPEVLMSTDGIQWCRSGFEVPEDAVVRDATALPDGRLIVVGSSLAIDEQDRPRNVARAWISAPLPDACDAVESRGAGRLSSAVR